MNAFMTHCGDVVEWDTQLSKFYCKACGKVGMTADFGAQSTATAASPRAKAGTGRVSASVPSASLLAVVAAFVLSATPAFAQPGGAVVTYCNSGGSWVPCTNTSGGSGGTAIADDEDFVDGTTVGTPIGGVAESASPTAVTEGDFGWAAITLNRALKTAFYTPAGDSVANDTLDALKVTNSTAADATSYLTVRLSNGTAFLAPGSDATHDSAVSSTGPQQVLSGVSAEATAVSASGDAVRAVGDLVGRQVILPYGILADTVTATPVGITDGSSTSVVAAAGAGVRNYITDIECANSSATDVTVDIRDGTAGAVLWTMSCPAGAGNNRTFARPIRGSANTAIAADPSASASTVTISMLGFRSTQ